MQLFGGPQDGLTMLLPKRAIKIIVYTPQLANSIFDMEKEQEVSEALYVKREKRKFIYRKGEP